MVASLAEKEAGLAPACPACGSADVGRVFSRVIFLRSSEKGRSATESDPSEAGGEWGPGGGADPGDFGDGGMDDAGGEELDGDHSGFDGLGDEDADEPGGEEFPGELEDDRI